MNIHFTWSESKRRRNIQQHGIDFIDATLVFAGFTYTIEDNRFAYFEQRFISLGLLAEIPVSIAHTENAYEIRIISFRKATRQEAALYFQQIRN
jgi:uncharacterized protein